MTTRLSEYFNLHFYKSTIPAVLIALIIAPCTILFPARYGFENGPIENLQIFVLLATAIIAFCARNNKKLFIFVGLIIIALLLRETSYGRTLFFAVPNTENKFYKWTEIKYGWLAHPIYGLFLLSTATYFILNKLHRNILQIIHTSKIPFWNTLMLLSGLILGIFAEKIMHNTIFEEMSELLFYTALCGIIYIYANKNFAPR